MMRTHAEPLHTPDTVPHLHACARGLSRQAIELYRDLGRRMAELGNEQARETFEHIEAIQRDHADLGDGAEIGPAPDVLHGEDLGTTRLVTPYLAYALAVRNGERAFAFWSYTSARANDPALRAEAERLARLEMEHMGALRAARRRAYHEDRPSQPSAEVLRAASLADFCGEAARREAALADLHERIAKALSAAGEPLAAELAEIAREEAESARNLGGATGAADSPDLPGEARALLALATARLEAAVEFCLLAAEQSSREDVVAAAQELADQGIHRLSRLR